MQSQHYKNWLSIEDARRCKRCAEKHGQIYEIGTIPDPEPPLHDNCRCYIAVMKAIYAGEATSKGKNGADWWILKYRQLPPYYITREEAKSLGWKPKRGNLQSVAPGKWLHRVSILMTMATCRWPQEEDGLRRISITSAAFETCSVLCILTTAWSLSHTTIIIRLSK